ncbi:MAG: thiamine phosphate synthase [Ferrovibrio sp.]|nr:MAG: thiamine phosphate synthase [Ferrovibrio sp.]
MVMPGRWLVTDAGRLPDPLPAIGRLERGDGVLFRHYELAPAKRLALAQQVAELCRRRGLVLLVAGDARLARAVSADGLHLPQALIEHAARARRMGLRLVTVAAHDAAAIARAARCGADAVLISPVFATASHPGAAPLGVLRLAALATEARRRGLQVYALGGVTPASFTRLRQVPLAGYAAIGAFSPQA